MKRLHPNHRHTPPSEMPWLRRGMQFCVIFIFLMFCTTECFILSALGEEPKATISFYGAAETIGGSCHLLDTGYEQILLDCGAFMNEKYQHRNLGFPFYPGMVTAVTLSHAHVDHSGRLPLLFHLGFRGPVLCVPPTRELASIMMNIQMKIARSEHLPIAYTKSDIDMAVSNFHEIERGQSYRFSSGTTITFYNARHILGSALTHVRFGPPGKEKTLLFTGDFGNAGNSILFPRDYLEQVDYLLVESTYGGKNHGDYLSQRKKLYKIVRDTVDDGGVTIIPSFVLARTQKVLAWIYRGIELGKIPHNLNIYIDSPSASTITKLYAQYPQELAKPFRGEAGNSPFTYPKLHLYKTFDQIQRPAVVIVPSADASRGKVVKYLKEYIERPDTRICFVSSYVVPGSVGEQLLKKKAKEVKIDGKYYQNRAKIFLLGSFSGHGDQKQILEWLSHFKRIKRVFVVHGTPRGTYAMKEAIVKHFGWPVIIPQLDQTYILETGKRIK